MKAVQFQDVDKLALEELDTPSIKDDEVLVALRSVGAALLLMRRR